AAAVPHPLHSPPRLLNWRRHFLRRYLSLLYPLLRFPRYLHREGHLWEEHFPYGSLLHQAVQGRHRRDAVGRLPGHPLALPQPEVGPHLSSRCLLASRPCWFALLAGSWPSRSSHRHYPWLRLPDRLFCPSAHPTYRFAQARSAASLACWRRYRPAEKSPERGYVQRGSSGYRSVE